ncbi:MAG: nucleotidyltransferase family protein, partial [Desulfobacterales bacterium]|nr:nucleotidyltransferase family protein [Desulfobacterales bacterium]
MTAIEQKKILIWAASLDSKSALDQQIGSLLADQVEMDHLLNLALKEGLAGLLYKRLLESGLLENLDPSHQQKLQSIYYQGLAVNLNLMHDLKEVLRLLGQEKIRVVLLQGIHLLLQVYEDAGLRPMTDIDLWVLERDYPAVTDTLQGQGYEPDLLYPTTFRRGSTVFDLHTHILWADRIKARTLLLARGEEVIYRDARVIRFEGEEALCLNPYDQILYLGLHALKHRMNRLLWLADIRVLLSGWNGADWKGLLGRAKDLGQEKTLCYLLFLLRHLFAFPLPEAARELTERKGLNILERKALRGRVKSGSLPPWAPLLLFPSGKGLRTQLLFISETLFPRPEIMRQIFPSFSGGKVWKLYLQRVAQLAR